MQTTMTDRLWGLFEPYLAAEKIELDDLALQGTGKGTTLRVVVDAPGGVDLDRISDLAHHLSRLLDHQTDLSGPYNLEVTSPGLERKLHRPAHFQKSCGREVVLKLTDGTPGCRGTLVSADQHGISVQPEDGSTLSFSYPQIKEARTVFHWGASSPKEKK